MKNNYKVIIKLNFEYIFTREEYFLTLSIVR